jgi:hypothetical protein
MSLTLTNIPTIMRSHGWGNGARLMDIWFANPSAIAPAYASPDTTTIVMDSWVLTFPRAKSVYDQLMADRIWANTAAQGQIAALLRRKGLLTSGASSFGDLTQPVDGLDADYINFRTVSTSGLFSSLDDMDAALGNFTFHVVVAGSVEPDVGGNGWLVTINQVGVYVRDSYDFNGDQFLGYWDDSDNSVSLVNPLSGTKVTNASFRDWRTANNAGGDFLVYSDVKLTTLDSPDTFVIN